MWLFLLTFFALPVWPLEIVTDSLPVAILHRPYTPEPLRFGGGAQCTTNSPLVRIIRGGLPQGLTLSPAGHFGGIPRQRGVFAFTLEVSNICQRSYKNLILQVDGAPILQVEPESLEVQYRVGDPMPAVLKLLVGSSWHDLPYSIDAEGAKWITLRPLRGRTPVPGDALVFDPVRVSLDPAKLAPGVYRAMIRVTAWGTSNEPEIPVTLTVTSAK